MSTNGIRGRPRKQPRIPVTLPPGRAALSPEESAETLGISRMQVYRLMNNGELVSFHIGRKHRITADSIADYVIRQVAAEGQSA